MQEPYWDYGDCAIAFRHPATYFDKFKYTHTTDVNSVDPRTVESDNESRTVRYLLTEVGLSWAG
jgi:hypothetical protein